MNFKEIYLKNLKKDLPKMLGVSVMIGLMLYFIFYSKGESSFEMAFLLSAHGSIISFVLWFGNGFIVDLDDIDALTDKILFCLQEPFELQELSYNARTHMINEFSSKRLAENMRSIYCAI